MKRAGIVLCLMVLLVCALPAMGCAASVSTAEEWELYCLHTMQTSATVYELMIEEVAEGEENLSTGTDLTYVFNPIGQVDIGAAVSPTGQEAQGKIEITYWSGSRCYGFVDASAVARTARSVTAANGKTYELPSRVIGNDALLRRSIALRYPGEDAEMIIDALNGGGASDGKDDSGSGSGGSGTWSGKVAEAGAKVSVTLVGEDGEEQPVTVETLGLVTSVITLDGEEVTVNTADLRWATEVDADKRLAVINAPRTGKATLHAKSSSKSAVLDKCDTNRVVLVLASGKNYTRIAYDNTVGYVLTSALKFYPAGGVGEDEEPPKLGWVSFRGKLDSKNTINIRMNG
ncbi:MAG: hypothetical protein ACI4ML_08190, partial [Aristaeellaceae bacterium]